MNLAGRRNPVVHCVPMHIYMNTRLNVKTATNKQIKWSNNSKYSYLRYYHVPINTYKLNCVKFKKFEIIKF